jgi:hypothetical protein
MGFVKAERRRAKARVALTGTSGSGKTASALLLAKGLGGKIAVIDTENESAALYSGKTHLGEFEFDTQPLFPPYTPERYIAMIHEAENAGYDVLIIDSGSHEWVGAGGLLEVHDSMPGNGWTNWAKITPRHESFTNAILNSKCHIIMTMRSKTEYAQTDKDGRKTIEKLGLAPQQREGADYLLTICLDITSGTHVASASKDRTGLWNNRYEVITEAHGKELLQWLEQGIDAPVPTPPTASPQRPATAQPPRQATNTPPAATAAPTTADPLAWFEQQAKKLLYLDFTAYCEANGYDYATVRTDKAMQKKIHDLMLAPAAKETPVMAKFNKLAMKLGFVNMQTYCAAKGMDFPELLANDNLQGIVETAMNQEFVDAVQDGVTPEGA